MSGRRLPTRFAEVAHVSKAKLPVQLSSRMHVGLAARLQIEFHGVSWRIEEPGVATKLDRIDDRFWPIRKPQ